MDVTPSDQIIVSRSVEYVRAGTAGNPLDLKWVGRRYVLEFTWNERHYRFDQHGAPIVLTVDATGTPAILGPADAGSWYMVNGYQCTVPFYVQFNPAPDGVHWNWSKRIDPIYYGRETNLLQTLPRPDAPSTRLTSQKIKELNSTTLGRSPQRLRVEPRYTGDECKGKEKG